jgi:predicted HD phosphohydrolase
MGWPTAEELDDLVARFQSRTLPKSEWTHQAHLAVGTWHVHRLGPDEALLRLRSGIRLLNDSHGTPNTDSTGYHETITRAYVMLLAAFIADRDGQPAAYCAQALLASPLAARDALLTYYSKDLLMSVQARLDWVEPDLSPLLNTDC